ncbi:MAG TPA: hypothetical protein VF109_05155 [Mycobacteriales bacterium]
MSRSVLRLLTVAGATCAAVGLTAVPALAHVTVSSPGATQGGFAVKLAAAASTGGTGATVSTAPAAGDAAGKGSVTGAYVLGAAGLLTGLAGLVLGLGARRRRATVGERSTEAVSTGVQ